MGRQMPNLNYKTATRVDFFPKVLILVSLMVFWGGCQGSKPADGLKFSKEFVQGYNSKAPYKFFYVVKVMFDQNNLYFTGDIEGSLPMPDSLRQYLKSFQEKTCLTFLAKQYFVSQPDANIPQYEMRDGNMNILIGKIFDKVPEMTADLGREYFIRDLNAFITNELQNITEKNDFELNLVPSDINGEYQMQLNLKENQNNTN